MGVRLGGRTGRVGGKGRTRAAGRLVLVGVGIAAVLLMFAGPSGAGPKTPARSATPALARSATAGAKTSPIQHIVLIMQENHSFDNVLGKFCEEVDTAQIVRPGYNSGCDGATTGELFNGKEVSLATAPDVVPEASHSVSTQTADIAGGQMNGFDSVNGSCPYKSQSGGGGTNYKYCYNQYDPLAGKCSHNGASCIPYLGALATRYSVADKVFELAGAPSWGGHLYAAAATLDGFTGDQPVRNHLGFPIGQGWGCDSGRVAPWGSPPTTSIPSCVPNSSGSLGPVWKGYNGPKAAYVPTIFDRLDAAGLSWKLYAALGKPGDGTGWGWAICPSFDECLNGPQRANVHPASRIISDANNLPAFSIVTPTPTKSQHNGDSMLEGDNWINQVVSAIQAGADWSSTAIFITYDDCGCQYDHVAPPNGWGIRVPMVIVSPYAKLGFTDETPTTIAGFLAFAEHTFGLAPLNSVDSTAYDFSGSFCFTDKCTAAGLAPVKMPFHAVTALTPAQLTTQQQQNMQDT